MNKTINKLKKFLISLKIKFILIVVTLSVVFFKILCSLWAFFLNTYEGCFFILIFISVVCFIFSIIITFDYFDTNWITDLKKIIIQDILLLSIKPILNIENIKYNSNAELENNTNSITISLIYFINNLLLTNSKDNFKAFMSIYKSFHTFNFKLENQIIIEINNKSIKIMETTLSDIYEERIYSEVQYTYRYYEEIITINNFYGACIIIPNPTFYITPDHPILIFNSNLFHNSLDIKLLKPLDEDITNFDPSSYSRIVRDDEGDLIKIKDLKYEIKNINQNVYCLYHIEQSNILKQLDNILLKLTEKIYLENNYSQSFIVLYNIYF